MAHVVLKSEEIIEICDKTIKFWEDEFESYWKRRYEEYLKSRFRIFNKFFKKPLKTFEEFATRDGQFKVIEGEDHYSQTELSELHIKRAKSVKEFAERYKGKEICLTSEEVNYLID